MIAAAAPHSTLIRVLIIEPSGETGKEIRRQGKRDEVRKRSVHRGASH